MTIRDHLAGCGLPSADAEVLLAHAFRRNRTWLLAHALEEVGGAELEEWTADLQRAAGGEPVAYITGEKEFYGRRFVVDPRVLIPRPCTERLVDAVLAFARDGTTMNETIDAGIVCISVAWGKPKQLRTVADIGTGSGCIAVSVARALPHLRVIATDVSGDALELAEENARALGANVEFRRGDALSPLLQETDPFFLVSNPPYIPAGRKLETAVSNFEPQTALFAGPDGTDVLYRLARQAAAHPACLGVAFECEENQREGILRLISTRVAASNLVP